MRKKKAPKRLLAPDPKFNDQLVTRFINTLMWSGKKTIATTIFYDAMTIIDNNQTSEMDGYTTWKEAIQNVTPAVEVKSKRIGGATFQIPAEVRPDRKISLAMKWIIRFSRDRNGKSMAEKLANELMAAAKKEGAAFKKREDTHKMAEANKAFAHFR
jgi:small subunit ribosomal protein S7